MPFLGKFQSFLSMVIQQLIVILTQLMSRGELKSCSAILSKVPSSYHSPYNALAHSSEKTQKSLKTEFFYGSFL